MIEIGTVIAGYRVEGVLGQGGMGTVYEALQLSLNRPVALKVLSPQLSADTAFRERFRREGLLQASIDHPHILTVYEAGEANGSLFLAMRLVRGPTLKDMIFSRLLDPERTIRVLHPVGDALETAHEFGLIHRDVTPQNVLVGTRDHAYLSDFGLTKVVGQRGVTQQNQFVGTVDYVSPEQVRRHPATTRSDVYSLGAVAYECLTGAVPFPRETDPEVLFAHLSEPPPRPSERRPELPASLDAVIERAMAKQPEARFASPAELMREVEAALREAGAADLGPPPPVEGGAAGVRPRTSEVFFDERGLPATVPPGGAAVAAPARTAAEAETQALRGTAATAALTGQPKEAAAPSRRWPPRSTLALGAVVIAAAAAGGVVAGAGSGEDGGGDRARRVTAPDGVVSLALPPGWRVPDRRPRIAGMRFRDPIAITPRGGPEGAGALAGVIHVFGPSLLSTRFILRIGGPPSREDRVRLGQVGAYRYTDLLPEGLDRRMTVFAAPTTGGTATVACYVPESVSAGTADDYLERCEGLAATLRVVGATPYPLEPNREYAKLLRRVMGTYNAERGADRTKLRRADTDSERAAIAHALDRNSRVAARTLDRALVSPAVKPTHARLVAALERMAGGYADMSEAAAAGDAARYDAAAEQVARSDGRIQGAFEELKPLGYRLV